MGKLESVFMNGKPSRQGKYNSVTLNKTIKRVWVYKYYVALGTHSGSAQLLRVEL